MLAKPHGSSVRSGEVSFKESGSSLEINASDKAIIDWKGFSIDKNELVKFFQPSVNSAVLNRVFGGEVSEIFGRLEANGFVYLLNPNGILIGREGVIDTGGFIASTFDCFDRDFLQDRELLFSGDSKDVIVNEGTVRAKDGDILLIGYRIQNRGTLEAQSGAVCLGAGLQICVQPKRSERIFIIPGKNLELQKEGVGIEQIGVIKALQVEVKAFGNPYAIAIKQTGSIEATGFLEKEGKIFLVADGGMSQISGQLTAKSQNKGGEIRLLGNEVGITEGATIDVSGDFGGGTVLVGGDFQGKNSKIANAKLVVMEKGTIIDASAKHQGRGGRVILFSEGATFFEGDIQAKGAGFGGDGGLIEISGKEYLHDRGNATAFSSWGNPGEIFLDPTNVTIATNAGVDTNAAFSVVAGTGSYTYSAATSTLDNALLATRLGTSNVVVSTDSSFNSAGTISVMNNVVWNSAFSLSLLAASDISFQASVRNNGSGSISITSPSTITLTSPVAPVEVRTNTGNVTMTSGVDILLNPQGVNSTSIRSNERLAITAGRDLILNGNATGGDAFIATGSSANTFVVGRDLILNGGSGAASSVEISSQFSLTSMNPMDFSVGGNVTLMGGSGAGSYALIANVPASPGSANLLFSEIGGNLTLTGGTAADSFCLVGCLNTNNVGLILSGNITLDHIGGNVVLQSSGIRSLTQIGYFDSATSAASQYTGDVRLNQIDGNVVLQGGSGANSSAIIGHGNSLSHPGNIYAGSIVASSGGAHVTLQPGTGARSDAIIGFEAAVGATTTVNSSLVRVISGGTIDIHGGIGTNAAIGFYNNYAGTTTNVHIGLVEVQASSTLTLNAGNEIGGAGGAAAIGTFTLTGIASSNVNVVSGDLFLNGSVGANTGFARIVNGPIGAEDDPVDVTIHCLNGHIGSGSAALGHAEIYSQRNLTLIADKSLFLNPDSLIHTVNGTLVLVVDEKNSTRPETGSGRFVKLSTATITTNGPLFIFTSKRDQNFIEGLINGAPFIPGPLYLNSSSEVWDSYFSEGIFVNGFPFTIFYKDGAPNFRVKYGAAISEAFHDLATYDDFLFVSKYFEVGYDKISYEFEYKNKKALSSYELFRDEILRMIRRTYRNYNTKYIPCF
ncbi:MAG: filamentous hemagglutinin N-terminal domain-containing protein [Chlamydiae bacterium]|nr:filamentous hemagglutinin N-terminal domain-containing protein [Chlamydiota bacterium]